MINLKSLSQVHIKVAFIEIFIIRLDMKMSWCRTILEIEKNIRKWQKAIFS